MFSSSAGATQVYINVYDYTSSNSWLQKCGMGIYHTGVELNDVEYCFCVIDSNPDASGVVAIQPETADYTFNRKIPIGFTTKTREQIHNLIIQLGKKYTCGEYHIFRNNCNHFTNELAMILTGQGLTNTFFRSTDCLKCACCCLPQGLVSGQWELERLKKIELERMSHGF